jgi:hypothetical protein
MLTVKQQSKKIANIDAIMAIMTAVKGGDRQNNTSGIHENRKEFNKITCDRL